ncbi:DUF6968 family protein [Sorangium sp. So ce1000]|uniref:DUF6968 family protein n=1 Tax=Sorangium sp. So ce1000 TaxID=3133325 RepID=UPI003F5E6F8A
MDELLQHNHVSGLTNMAKKISHPIAVRRYAVEGEPDREIVLAIGKPIPPKPPGDEWSCPLLISGLSDKEFFHYVPGIDAIQALQLAMKRARHELDASKLPIKWLGEVGDIGLPRSIDPAYGMLRFQRLMEGIYDMAVDMVGQIALDLDASRKAKEAPKTTRKKRT